MKKLYKVSNQPISGYYNDNDVSVVGWEIVDKNLIITNVKGINLTLEGFLQLCYLNRDYLTEIAKGYTRVCPYKVEDNSTYRCKYQIRYLIPKGNFFQEKLKDILYISSHGKLTNQTIFIPDLLLIVEDLIIKFGRDCDIKEIQPIENPEDHEFIIPKLA